MLCKFFANNIQLYQGFKLKESVIIANSKLFPKIQNRYKVLIEFTEIILNVSMSMGYFVIFSTRHSTRTLESSAYYCGANGSLGRDF